MLDLRRLRLLRELHARGTIAAVADALQYTPSAVSQQLAGPQPGTRRPPLEPPGRGLRLAGHPAARAHPQSVPLAELSGAPWVTGHPEAGWDELTTRTCRWLGGFDPDI